MQDLPAKQGHKSLVVGLHRLYKLTATNSIFGDGQKIFFEAVSASASKLGLLLIRH